MDNPLPVPGLIAQCIQLVIKVREMGSTYSAAEQTLDATANECNALSTTLEKIQTMPSDGRPERLKAGQPLQRDLDLVLDGCSSTLGKIWKMVQSLDSELSSSSWTTTLTRNVSITSAWDDKAMVAYLEELRNEHGAFRTIILAYSLESTDDMHAILQDLKPCLSKIKADARPSISHRRTKSAEPQALVTRSNRPESRIMPDVLSDLASPLYADHGRYPRLSQYMPAIDENAAQASQDLPTRWTIGRRHSSRNPPNSLLSRTSSLRAHTERPLPPLPDASNPPTPYRQSQHLRTSSASTASTSSGTTGRVSSSNHTAHPDDFSSPVDFAFPSGPRMGGSDIFAIAGPESQQTTTTPVREPLRRKKSMLSSLKQRWSSAWNTSVDPQRLAAVRELEDMAGPSHVATVAKTLEKHDINTVTFWFQQIRSFGSGEHFHIALVTLARREFDIVYIGETLKRLRALGEESDYGYVIKYLQIHTYDMGRTAQTFRTLKSHFSTSTAYTSVLMLLERYVFNYEEMMGTIRSINESAVGGTQTYCDLIGFIASRGFDIQRVRKEFPELMAANWTQTALGPKRVPVTQDVLLREMVTLKLLERNSYDVPLTISQVDSLCGEENSETRQRPGVLTRKHSRSSKKTIRTLGDVSSASLDTSVLSFDRSSFMTTASYREAAMFVGLLPDRPRLPLKVLQKANYDYFDALDGIQWLNPITKTADNFRRAVEQGDYDLQKLRSSHDKMCKLIEVKAEDMSFVDNSISAHRWNFGETLELYERLYNIDQTPSELKSLLKALRVLKWNESRLLALLGDPAGQGWVQLRQKNNTLLEELATLQMVCIYDDEDSDKIVGKLLRDVDDCELSRVNGDISRLTQLAGTPPRLPALLRMLECRQLRVDVVEQDCAQLRLLVGHHGNELYDLILQILENYDFNLGLLISDCHAISESIRFAVGATSPDTSKIYKAAIQCARHFEYNLAEVLQGLRYIGGSRSCKEEPELYTFTVAVVYISGKRFEDALEALTINMEGDRTARAALDLWKISYAEEGGTL